MLKLYTINATPVRTDIADDVNDLRCDSYPELVAALLAKAGIDGFSIYEVKGYWQGLAERSFKIELALESDMHSTVWLVCKELKDTWNQDAVMLTNPDNSVEFI